MYTVEQLDDTIISDPTRKYQKAFSGDHIHERENWTSGSSFMEAPSPPTGPTLLGRKVLRTAV